MRAPETPDEARAWLTWWREVKEHRDPLVQSAASLGLTVNEISGLTGLSPVTVAKIAPHAKTQRQANEEARSANTAWAISVLDRGNGSGPAPG